MTSTAPAPDHTQIVFGTDGWRARIGEEFTYDNVRRCADGVARYVIERGEQAKGVVIAYDRRFSSEFFAQAAAEGRVAMGAMDAGWSDLGSWSALLSALGSSASGGVVKAGERASAGRDDLVVRRRDGALAVDEGPLDGILDPDGPSALLSGARADRQVIDALIERVAAVEAQLS